MSEDIIRGVGDRSLPQRLEEVLGDPNFSGDGWALSALSNCGPGSFGEVILWLELDGMVRREEGGVQGVSFFRLTERGKRAREMLLD
jgi:hypothetical protein